MHYKNFISIFVSLICLFWTESHSSDTNLSWDLYKVQFNKTFTSIREEQYRQYIYYQNIKNIDGENAKLDTNLFGINKYTDIEDYEFRSTHTNLKISISQAADILDNF